MSGINIKFSATDSGFSSTVNKINSSVKGLESNVRNVSGSVKDSFGGIEKAGAALAGVAAGIGALAAVTAAAQKTLSEYAAFDSLVRSLKTMDGTAAATTARLEQLRDVAKLPGLGFEEAIKGDVRLRSAGISAELAERSLRAVGNALASAGGGKSELDGVILALGQISSKGKVSAEEINQIAERLPQVRAAMKEAFGTADTEAIQAMGISSTEFISGLVAELEKLPAVTGGAQNTLDNFTDSWSALKTQASEFGVQMAGVWIDDVSRAFTTARKLLEGLKESLGMKTPGLEGNDGKTEAAKQAEIAADQKLKIEQEAASAEAKMHNANIDFWQKKEQERTEFLRSESAKRVEIERSANERTSAAQEAVFAARLTPEENIKRQISALESGGKLTAESVNKTSDPVAKAQVAENLAKVVSLQKELNNLESQSAEKHQQELKIAQEKQAVIDENRADMAAEIKALDLRREGQTKLADQLTEENKLRKEAVALAESLNISENKALGMIKSNIETAEETRLVAGGLSLRTQDRAEKRAAEKQTRKEDARLRNAARKNIKDRNDELRPGEQGKDRDQMEKEKRGEGKPAADPESPLQKAVEAIRVLVAKIEPKLPTAALGV